MPIVASDENLDVSGAQLIRCHKKVSLYFLISLRRIFGVTFSGFAFPTPRKFLVAKMLASLHFKKPLWKTIFSGFTSDFASDSSPTLYTCSQKLKACILQRDFSKSHACIFTFFIVYKHNVREVYCDKVKRRANTAQKD